MSKVEVGQRQRRSLGVTTYENVAEMVNTGKLQLPTGAQQDRLRELVRLVSAEYTYSQRELLKLASPKDNGVTHRKHESGKHTWSVSDEADAFTRFAQLAQECDSENELVWTCCNPLVAALLAAAHRQQGTDDEHILAVWDTQYHSSCDGKQPDQSVCASACYPSEHIIVGYNEAVFQKLDNKHTGKMGQYLKTALESNPQLDAAYGLLMCKTAIQVHCITWDSRNGIGSEWPFLWQSSPVLSFELDQGGGGVPASTKLWLAHWADRVVTHSNRVTTCYDIAMAGGNSATAVLGEHLGTGASSRVFSSKLGEEPIVLKVLHTPEPAEGSRELDLLRHFSGQPWCPTLKGVAMDGGRIVAIAMEHAGIPLEHGRLTQSMFKTLIDALEAIHTAPATASPSGQDDGGCWVHCDVRPVNVATSAAKLFLLDLGACTWSTTPGGHYVGTFHCASDDILDHLASPTARCPRSARSDLVSAVRTAMLLSLGPAVHNAVHAVSNKSPALMKAVWQELTPPAWREVVNVAARGEYAAVITAASQLLPRKIRGTPDTLVGAGAGAGADAGAGDGAGAGAGDGAGAGAGDGDGAGAGAAPAEAADIDA